MNPCVIDRNQAGSGLSRRSAGVILLWALLFLGACRKSGETATVPPTNPGDHPTRLAPVDADAIRAITWQTQGRSVTWQQVDGHWYFAGMEAVDDAVMQDYLKTLARLSAFARPHAEPVGLPVGDQLILVLASESEPLVITVYPVLPGKALMFHSSAMSDQYFLGDSLGMYARIFSALQRLRPDDQ